MSTPSAQKRLPVKPSEEHLRKQAKRRAKSDALSLADAQHVLAVEYGCRNWAELLRVVETMNRGADQLANVKRDVEPLPKAVRARDVALVRQILASREFTQHDLDAGLAHAAWYGGDGADVLPVRKLLFDLLLDHGADPDGQYGSAYGPIVFGTGECIDPDGLQWLIDAGADVTFPPVDTKYGKLCPLSHWLGAYARGANDKKHRGIDLLLKHNAFVPPEVTPPILAIHRGDAKALADLLDKDHSLVRQTFPTMPFGNIDLRGATLLHCAAEFDEISCIDALLDRYADMNAKAEIIDGVGGQTAIFHLVNTGWASHLATLEHLIRRAGQYMDPAIRATWRTWDGARPHLATAMEYALEPDAKGRKNREAEIALLESLEKRGRVRAAAASGDVALLGRLLRESPELLTPELWAPAIFQGRSFEAAKLLLDLGLDPNQCSAPRKPLHLAAGRGMLETVQLLLQRGARLDVVDGENITPYELLCCGLANPDNAEEIRQEFRRAGAVDSVFTHIYLDNDAAGIEMLESTPSLADAHGPIWFTPLQTAARAARPAVIRKLLSMGAPADDPRGGACTALWIACQSSADASRRIAVAKLLLEAGANPRRQCDRDRTTPLHRVAWRGPVEMVELLIRHGAREWQQDPRGRKAIDFAHEGKSADREKIIELLHRPVIRDANFRDAVKAIQTGDLAALKRLLADHPNLIHDAAVEPECYPPGYFSNPKLIWFIANNPNLIATMPANIVEITEALIGAGAEAVDLNYTLGLVMTSTPTRVQGHQRTLIKLLLARGATVTPTEVYSTLGHGERDAIVALLEAGMPLSASIAAGMGMTSQLAALLPSADAAELHAALSLAVFNRHLEAARRCLEAGADVNQRMAVHNHSMPIHQGAINDDVPMLQLLVEHGAQLDVRDTLWNGTPLGWAIHEQKPAAEAYLRSIGAP